MTIRHIAIVSVPVSDPDRALAFYRDQLAFEVVRDNPMGPDRRWIEVAPPGAKTSLALVTWFEKMPPGSVQGLVVDTADVDASHAALTAAGVEISGVEDAPWGRFAVLSDPDGNGLVLQEARG